MRLQKQNQQVNPERSFVKEVELPAYKDWRGYPDRFKEDAGVAYDEAR